MSKASSLLVGWVAARGLNNKTARHFALNHVQAASLNSALGNDAVDYLYSASVTLAASVRAVQASHYTWATIALYYSVFLSLRAFAANRCLAVFHVNRKPLAIHAVAGKCPMPQKGTTHDATARQFRNLAPHHTILSQTIDAVDPIEWLKTQRETANYRVARFPDPEPPPVFKQHTKYDIRRLLGTYLSKDRGLYAFDPDHAILAYPLFVYGHIHSQLRKDGRKVSIDETFISATCRNRDGPLTRLIEHLTQGGE